MFDFTDQVVVITGANGGLGTAVAHAFGQAGANLVLVGRSRERLEEAFPDMKDSDAVALVVGDLTDADEVARVVDEIKGHFGRIDVLINVAGGFRAGQPVHETEVKTWDFMLNLNARSVFLVNRAVVPHMLAQTSGKIINIGSRAAVHAPARQAAYSASKAAVVRLTESLSAELKAHGINVNCILPGTIDTEDNRRAMPKADTSKWVKPEELANVMLFLASDAAAAIHGAVLPVYGLG